MLSNEYALIKLFASVEQITGRKKLQKMVYLLQQRGILYNQKFKYHHYGPYSYELQSQIDRLVEHQLLAEIYTDVTYSYNITAEGKLFLQKHEQVFNSAFDLPTDAVKKLVMTDTAVLEMASTYAYLLEMGYEQREAEGRAVELKPHLERCLDEARTLFHDVEFL